MLPGTPILFVVGGLSPRSAQTMSESVLQILTADPSLDALSQAVTLARRARQMPWRTHFTFSPGSSFPPTIPNPVLIPKETPPIVMVFTGQGPQNINMGRHLFRAHKVFRDTIIEMDTIYEQLKGVSLIKSTGLFDGDHSTLVGIWSVEITLPALTMVQVALVDLLHSVGIKPDVVLGHSAGETAMLYASGAGSKAMALEISIARAEGMKLTEGVGGGMAALGCDLETVIRIVDRVKQDYEGVLEIACHNSSDSYVISGDGELVDLTVSLAPSEGIFARRIHTKVPSHSSITEMCKEKYVQGMEDVFARYPQPCRPSVRTFSTVAGQPRILDEFTPEYCWQNLRSPVHFQQAVSAVLEEYSEAVFVEISPHPALSSYISALGQSEVLCPMKRENKAAAADVELVAFAQALGSLITLGVHNVDLTSLYGRTIRNGAYDIPYPFTRRKFPMRIDGPRDPVSSPNDHTVLRMKMNSKTHPDLAQHAINGEPIVPAAAFLDMV
jgi:acyl transferase domain-containing protein